MKNEKYYTMICNRAQDTFNNWEQKEFIFERELYFFLHSLKGTAGSIGLQELTDIASQKLYSLTEYGEKKWTQTEWENYLSPLIETVIFYQKNLGLLNILPKKVDIKEYANKDFILIIDDDVVFLDFIKEVLENEGYPTIIASNGKNGLKLLYELKPSIVFLDLKLPDIDGFSILENIISKTKKDHTIIAIISTDDCKENRIQAYNIGAQAFIKKPIDKDILISYINNCLTYQRELKQSIFIDELTQVYNRKHLDVQLQNLINQFTRKHDIFSVAIADLDFFKKVNDTYGHLIGDDVLKGFANIIQQTMRNQDIVCRYGGEEFVILMPDTNSEEAFTLLEKLRKNMTQVYFQSPQKEFQVMFSAGIVTATTTNLHPKKLLEEADQALYSAKQSGRNQTIIFNSQLVNIKQQPKVTLIIVDDVHIIRNLITDHFSSWKPSNNYDIEVRAFSDGISFLNSDWYTPTNTLFYQIQYY